MNDNEANNQGTVSGSGYREAWPATATIETNPYLGNGAPVKEAVTAQPENALLSDQEIGKEDLSPESDRRAGRQRLFFATALVVFAICVGLGLWLRFGGTTRVDYPVRDQRRGQALAGRGATGAGGLDQSTGDQATEQAIAQAKQAINGGDSAAPNAGAPQPENRTNAPAAIGALAPLVLPAEVRAGKSVREN